MLHFSVLLQLGGWWLQILPCITANAFNHSWEQLLVQIAHGSAHSTQLQHIPPSAFCLLLGWEGCFLRGLEIVKGWSDLLKFQDALPFVHAALPLTTPRLPLQWGWWMKNPPSCLLPYPQFSLCTEAAEKGDYINPFRPLHTPVS